MARDQQKQASQRSLLKSKLQEYYQASTTIKLPFSNVELSIDESYVNLALVEEAKQRDKEKKAYMTKACEYDLFTMTSDRLRTYEDIYKATQTIPIENLFQRSSQVIVLGRAGIGKSTFCKYIAYQWATKQAWDNFDAIYWLPLRYLRYYQLKPGLDCTIIDLPHLAHFIRYILSIECPDVMLLQVLTEENILAQLKDKKQKKLLLIDGFDEAEMFLIDEVTKEPTIAGRIFNALLSISHYLLTSRPYAIQRSQFPLPKYDYYELLGFIDENIPAYIRRVFELTNKSLVEAQDLIHVLRKNPSIWGTVNVPMHLALICAILKPSELQEHEYITMSMLYQKLTRRLSERFIEKNHELPFKGAFADKKIDDEIDEEVAPVADFLGELAITGLLQNKLMFEYAFLKPLISRYQNVLNDYMDRLKPCKDKSNDKGNSGNTSLLNLIAKTGFLNLVKFNGNEEDKIICYFSHASLQEYFAAYWLYGWFEKRRTGEFINVNKIYKKPLKLIRKLIINPRYEIVCWFLAGLLQKSPSNLKKYLGSILEIVKVDGLANKFKSLVVKEYSNVLLGEILNNNERFYCLMLLLRCLDEANFLIFQNGEKFLIIFRDLAEELFIKRAHLPIDQFYRKFLNYLKLSQRLLIKSKIVLLIEEAIVTTQDDLIHASLNLTLSQLKAEDLIESLIKHIDDGIKFEIYCQIITNLSVIVNPHEKQRLKINLLASLNGKTQQAKLPLLKPLLSIEPNAAVPYLIKYYLLGDTRIKQVIIRHLIEYQYENILAILYHIDDKFSIVQNELLIYFILKSKMVGTKKSDRRVNLTVTGDYCGRHALINRFIAGNYEFGPQINRSNSTNHAKKLVDDLEFEWNITLVNKYEDYQNINEVSIVCFDITNEKTFEKAVEISHYLKGKFKKIVLAGLKSDYEKERRVSIEKGIELASIFGTVYIECSAKFNVNVTEVFYLASQIAVCLATDQINLAKNNWQDLLVPDLVWEKFLHNVDIFKQHAVILPDDLYVINFEKDVITILQRWILILLEKLARFKSTWLFDLSLIRLENIETLSKKQVYEIYVQLLKTQDYSIQKEILQRLDHLNKTHDSIVIDAHLFNVLNGSLLSRDISKSALLEMDIAFFNQPQQEPLLKFLCEELIKGKVLSEWEPIHLKLEQCGMLDTMEAIEALCKNLYDAQDTVYLKARKTLRKFEPKFTFAEYNVFYNAFKKNLRHESIARRDEARIELQRLDEVVDPEIIAAHLPEVVAAHISNLTDWKYEDWKYELQEKTIRALSKLETKLNETQMQAIYQAHILNLKHEYSYLREYSLRELKRLKQEAASNVITALHNNISNWYLDLEKMAVEAKQVLSSNVELDPVNKAVYQAHVRCYDFLMQRKKIIYMAKDNGGHLLGLLEVINKWNEDVPLTAKRALEELESQSRKSDAEGNKQQVSSVINNSNCLDNAGVAAKLSETDTTEEMRPLQNTDKEPKLNNAILIRMQDGPIFASNTNNNLPTNGTSVDSDTMSNAFK